MKKYITILFLSLFFALPVFADNINSIDLNEEDEQYFIISDTFTPVITGDFTFEAWIKLDTLPTDVYRAFNIISRASANPDIRSYQFGIDNDNDMPYITYTENGSWSPYTWVWSDNSFDETDVWIHLAVVVDVSNPSNPIFYKNGIPLEGLVVDDDGATSVFSGTGDFAIGGTHDRVGWYYWFDGKIDDVRIWNDLRTPTEIADNYDIELLGNESNLIGYWQFDNTSLDETANNNDLTAINGADYSEPTDIAFVYEPYEPTPSLKVITISSMASTSDMLASLGTLFTDLWPIIAVMAGIPLAFYMITRIQKLILLKEKKK